ncbi:DUF4174 domain-containing protein [Paracoccaceae bacterium GXU_MW_L88]
MKQRYIPTALIAVLTGGALMAADLESWRAAPSGPVPASEVDLAAFRWEARPIVVMADAPDDPAFEEQLAKLSAASDEVAERDILIVIDSDPSVGTALRGRLEARGFGVYLIGKDGGLKFSSETPVEMAEFNRIIDSMPMRAQEMRAAEN